MKKKMSKDLVLALGVLIIIISVNTLTANGNTQGNLCILYLCMAIGTGK